MMRGLLLVCGLAAGFLPTRVPSRAAPAMTASAVDPKKKVDVVSEIQRGGASTVNPRNREIDAQRHRAAQMGMNVSVVYCPVWCQWRFRKVMSNAFLLGELFGSSYLWAPDTPKGLKAACASMSQTES